MVSNLALETSRNLEDLLAEVSRELITTGIDNSDGIIVLPSTYPSGAPVVIRVRRGRDSFIVNDGGYGYLEAEHMGGTATFNRIGQTTARSYGVQYDGRMMFATRIERDKLANAIIFTGAASRKTIELTADKMAEERDNSNKDRFRLLLTEVFKSSAKFDVDFRGRSTKQWKFDAMVESKDHWTLFDMVTPHHVSINSTIVKFQDISRLDDAPKGVAMLVNKKAMDSADISMISEAAGNVVTLETKPEVLLHAA